MNTNGGRNFQTNDAASQCTFLPLLVEQMAGGHQQSLQALYDATGSLVSGRLMRMLDRQDAEEALLDVYMKAWKNAASYSRERGTVQSWLVTMTRSIAIDQIRRKRIRPEFGRCAELSDFLATGPSPEKQTEDIQRSRKLQQALLILTADQRRLLSLAFFDGLTHSELAKQTGHPLGTVKTRIRAGLFQLRILLQEEKPSLNRSQPSYDRSAFNH